MTVPNLANLAISTVLTAPTPGNSGTSLVVASGHGGRFPAVPFQATVFPANAGYPDPSNAEIITVTARSSDTFTTIVRAQEGTTARSIVAGDVIIATVTKQVLEDLAGSVKVTQTTHGLAVGDVIRHNGTIYVKAKADTAANAEVIGIVRAVPDADTFYFDTGGDVNMLSGLTPGAVYFLSPSTAGALTATEPVALGQISKPVLFARSATGGTFVNYRGAMISLGSAVSVIVTQANSFAVGDVLYHNGTSYAKAQADTVGHAEVVGIVAAADSSSFMMVTSGIVNGLSGLTAGTVYFLSPTTAGALTATEPTGIGQVSKPVLIATSTTAGVFTFAYRGALVTSAEADTDLFLYMIAR